ncbi:MAG: hypothetical protein JWP72_4082, partial [Massilia sp.]|nr:hypothetical protein [Massilia sp.]
VLGSLLASLYRAAVAVYVGGIAVTASGRSGATELVLAGPLRQVIEDHAGDDVGTRVSIDETGIEVQQERGQENPRENPKESPNQAAGGTDAAASDSPSGVVRGAEGVAKGVAGRGIRISTGIDEESRATQAALGLASVLGGIVLFLVSLVLTRYAALGVKRYVQMNLSLLRGA